MKKELILGVIGSTLSATGTALQPQEVLQIISLVITIIGAIISMIVIPLLTWFQKAKKDGKITIDEVKEGVETLHEGMKGVKHVLDDKKKGDN